MITDVFPVGAGGKGKNDMRDVTLELRLLPRIRYSLWQVSMVVCLIYLSTMCGIRLTHDVESVLSDQHIHFFKSFLALVLLVGFVWGLVWLLLIIVRYPILLCARIEVRANLLTMFSSSGRKLAQIDNVHAEVRRKSNPKAVWFRAAPESRDNFDIPLWLIDKSLRATLLDCVG
jgi:hypothetical protein